MRLLIICIFAGLTLPVFSQSSFTTDHLLAVKRVGDPQQSIERVARRTPAIYVTFGAPYVIAGVPSASTVVVAWTGLPAAQRAAARVILGARAATGRLPVSVLPSYPIGHPLQGN